MKKISLLFCLIILQAGLLCGCRLPHKSSPQKPVEGENKSLGFLVRTKCLSKFAR